ncbi:MAG: hypothetical protein LQ345_006961 [Seirophora villosa]|nr:MAG: hypothetical protein LQ345_006961 [Seirophora villosa]
MPAAEPYPSPPSSPDSSSPEAFEVDPVLRNALRYTISAKEYQTLHEYLINRSPAALRKRAPSPEKVSAISRASNDHNAAAIRASLRVFIASQTGLQVWDLITTRLLSRGSSPKAKAKASILRSPNLRLSLSLSLILYLHRVLFRFFTRLRSNLLSKDAAPFRRRNPRIAGSLTSRLAPAVGASLAGFALGVYPADQLRLTIAIYVSTRAAEFAYNALDNEGWFPNKPRWWGSWMLMPLATGQLLHAFVFDRDCFPKAYGDFILSHTPNYLQRRPRSYPSALSWPEPHTIVDSLAEMSRLHWPPFVSPILYPNNHSPLPSTLASISPITDPAHPSIPHLSCALLHPGNPSCSSTFLTYILAASPPLLKFFTLIYTLFSLPRWKAYLSSPSQELNGLAKRILRTTLFITMAIGSSWGSICLFANLLPRAFLPTQRWFLGGLLGGLWAFVDRKGGRSNFLYSVRLSVDSAWKVGRKRGWWKGVRGGDVGVFVAGLMLVNAVYERDAAAVQGGMLRKGLGFLRGEGFVDRLAGREGEGREEVERKSES